jgi:hypothetical protein
MPDPTIRTAAEIEAELSTLQDPVELDLPPVDDDVPAPTPADLARLESETAAGQKGWVPKDQYKGDPTKWVDAKTFLERGEKFNLNLQREVAALKSKLESFEGTRKAFAKFHEETVAKKDEELKAAIAQLRIQRSEAQADGDHAGAVAIEDRIDLLRDEQKAIKAVVVEPPPAAAAPGPNLGDPVLQEWIEDGNAWFESDTKLRDYAVALGEAMIKGGTPLRGRKFLDSVRAKMEEEFPRKFRTATAPGARPAGAEGSSSARSAGSSSGTGGKTEADLPAEDRALMRQFIKEGWTTKEKFLSSYFSR